MADDLIVINNSMPVLTREARFTTVGLSVYDDSYDQPPADIDEKYILLAIGASLQVFAMCHGTCVIVNGHSIAQLFREAM